MRFKTVNEWLDWQQGLSPVMIDLGLERVARVSEAMALDRPAGKVITVAGTNGKGSCVAMLEAILLAAGYRVGTYTSPHLLRYNERIRLNGRQVDDQRLCQAFEHVDRQRADVRLTYFEFGTLAALDLFRQQELDVAVLEVGLGGRLDAVNIVDADVALVTSIALDHVDWLGPDRETIAREKAGIFRPAKPAVCCDPQPPVNLSVEAGRIGAPLYCLGRDFWYRPTNHGDWTWQHGDNSLAHLPTPALSGDFQYANAAGAIMALEQSGLAYEHRHVSRGLTQVRLPGRFQQLFDNGRRIILDVAHNGQAASALAAMLGHTAIEGRVRAVIAMLNDKDIDGTVRMLADSVDDWYVAGLNHPRGCPAAQMAQHIRSFARPRRVCDSVLAAYRAALGDAEPDGDCILVFGSFYTVAEVLDTVPAARVGASV